MSQTPEYYVLPAQLVANIYRLMGQVPAAQGGRVYVQLEDEIGRQNQQHNEQPQADDDSAGTPETG